MTRRLADEGEARAAGGGSLPAREDLLSAASHALKGPLQTILGMAELLRDEAYGPLTDEQRRAVRRVVEGSEVLDRRLEAVVGLVRADAYRPDTDAEAVDLTWIARAAVRQVAPEAGERGWRVSDDVPEGHPSVRGSVTELHTLLVTLMRVLMVEADDPGGATLTVRGRRPADGAARLELRAEPGAGPGTPTGGDRSCSPSFELYVARRLAAALGARLRVERDGQGRPVGARLRIPLHDGGPDV